MYNFKSIDIVAYKIDSFSFIDLDLKLKLKLN